MWGLVFFSKDCVIDFSLNSPKQCFLVCQMYDGVEYAAAYSLHRPKNRKKRIKFWNKCFIFNPCKFLTELSKRLFIWFRRVWHQNVIFLSIRFLGECLRVPCKLIWFSPLTDRFIQFFPSLASIRCNSFCCKARSLKLLRFAISLKFPCLNRIKPNNEIYCLVKVDKYFCSQTYVCSWLLIIYCNMVH